MPAQLNALRTVTPAPPAPPKPRPASRRPHAARDLPELLADAARGDERAWSQLVTRLDPVPRGVARALRLSPDDVQDVVQATWVTLFTHIDRIRDPAALPGWLATTARREALRLLQRPVREELTDNPDLGDGVDLRSPEVEVLAAEQRKTLARAIDTLPDRHRRLMTLMTGDADPDYHAISAMMGVPRGSIGPIRSRSLARLRRDPGLHRLHRVA